MRILFDNGTPRGLARLLRGHAVEEARARGWEELANGELIEAAEQAGFDVLLTTDKNIRHQSWRPSTRRSPAAMPRSKSLSSSSASPAGAIGRRGESCFYPGSYARCRRDFTRVSGALRAIARERN